MPGPAGWSVGGLLWIGAAAVGRTGRPLVTALEERPFLGNQQARVCRRQIEHVPDMVLLEVDAVDLIRKFSEETHSH